MRTDKRRRLAGSLRRGVESARWAWRAARRRRVGDAAGLAVLAVADVATWTLTRSTVAALVAAGLVAAACVYGVVLVGATVAHVAGVA